MISVRGTATAPITIIGMPDPTTGQLPIIDGTNAVTNSQWVTDYEPLDDLSLVLIGTTPQEVNANYYWSPGYINLENLQIQNGYQGAAADQGTGPALTYTAYDGTIRAYSTASGIYIEKGDNITIKGCTIDDNNQGIFAAGQSDARNLENLTIESDDIYGNGTIGSYSQHNSYVEGINTTYEYDVYGPLRAGAGGDGIKDRGAGTVIEYCTISAGGHLIDLCEAQNYAQITLTLPSYRTSYVLGNILYDPSASGDLINYGGDQGVDAFNRKGTLYFDDNTVYIEANIGSPYLVFGETTSAESIDAVNNIIYASSFSQGTQAAWVDLLQPWGLAYFGNNWIGLYPETNFFVSQAIWDSGNETGLLAGSANLIFSASGPDFDSLDPTSEQFLQLGSSSDAIGEAGILPGNCPPVLYEPDGTTAGILRDASGDLGAL
jgi:parallel beta-helix repeat protein